MDKIRNLSLRKTILLYMTAALLCSFILSAVIARIATRVQLHVWWHYVDEEAYFEAAKQAGPYFLTDISRPQAYEMTQTDYFVSELCDFLQTYTVLVLSMAGSCGAVFLFYRNKLRRPILELAAASKQIAKNQLDFGIAYENREEMGVLCREIGRAHV